MPVAEHARRVVNTLRAAVSAARLLDGASPHEVVWRSGPVRLRRYLPAAPAPGAKPLLLVTPIINRFRVVDLRPETSLVGSLVAAGIPVYLVDWGEPRRIDAGIDFEDYVLRYLPRAAQVAGGGEPVDVVGYCLGGTIAAMFAARSPGRVRRLVTINAPVRFLDRPKMDQMRTWVEPAHFPVGALTEAFGNMPGGLIAQGFVWQHPLANALKGHGAWRRFGERSFAEFFTALESWNQHNVDVPGAAYRRLIRELYREDRLARGELLLAGEPVDLARIAAPLLVVTAARDTICPPEAARALLELASSPKREELALRGGHVAAVVGPKSIATLHRPLAEWLQA